MRAIAQFLATLMLVGVLYTGFYLVREGLKSGAILYTVIGLAIAAVSFYPIYRWYGYDD